MAVTTTNLGVITAYGDAVAAGYTGTKAEWQALMASYATVGQQAVDAKNDAVAAKNTAVSKATEATTAASTATTKANEASASAQSIAQSASQIAQNTSDISELKEDLNVIEGDLYNKYQYKLIEKGTINASTGVDETSGTRARTSGFIDFGHLYGVVVTGNTVQYSLRFWDGETYKGASASWIDGSKTATELKPNFNITRIKVVFRYANDANIDLYDVLDKVKVVIMESGFAAAETQIDNINEEVFEEVSYGSFVNGQIAPNTGEVTVANNRAYTTGYISINDLVGIDIDSSAKFSMRYYNAGAFVGSSPAWITASKTKDDLMPTYPITDIRVVVAKNDDSAFVPSDIISHVDVRYMISHITSMFEELEQQININKNFIINDYTDIAHGTINAITGALETSNNRIRTKDYIPIDSFYGIDLADSTVKYSLRFYDDNGFIGSSADWVTTSKTAEELITNQNAKRIKIIIAYSDNSNIGEIDYLLDVIRIKTKIFFNGISADELYKKYHTPVPTFESTGLKRSVDSLDCSELYLIAIKSNNEYYTDTPSGKIPVPDGYLYLNAEEQKLYWSSKRYDAPEYLCDWDMTVSENVKCERYRCTITKDGDLIFIRVPYGSRIRYNPIIYPHGDYSNPTVIDFGDSVKPFGWAVDSGVDHSYNGDFFMFGEYRGWDEDDNDTELYIWKVSKPYNRPQDWSRVFTQYVRHYNSGPGTHPGEEIGHFHTMNFDFYSGDWIASSGDADFECKFFVSSDDGATWTTQDTPASQISRTVGCVFTEDGMYYQTDSTRDDHVLMYVERDVNGKLDFSTLAKVIDLTVCGSAGYGTALLQNPYGLLFIDRMENGYSDTKYLPLYFYDLKNRVLHRLGNYYPISGYTQYDGSGRFGFPPLAYTHYQSPYEDGIVMGADKVTKPFNLDICGNNAEYLKGVLKISVI